MRPVDSGCPSSASRPLSPYSASMQSISIHFPPAKSVQKVDHLPPYQLLACFLQTWTFRTSGLIYRDYAKEGPHSFVQSL